jgi:succinate dehydrogenase/fumarate reductase flavoprotein subunit
MVRDLGASTTTSVSMPEADLAASRFDPHDGEANAFVLRHELGSIAWDYLGIIRSATSLADASRGLDHIEAKLANVGIPADRAGHAGLHERMNIENLIAVARLIHNAATLREESRGSHYREDFPDTSPDGLYNITQRRRADGSIASERKPVQYTRRRPADLSGDTVIPTEDTRPGAVAMTTDV